MSAGITKIHGTVETGYNDTQNVTGSRGDFLSGYQLRFFRFTGNFNDASIGGALETLVRKVETVATVMMIGVPDGSYIVLGLDGASFNGRGDYTGYGDAGMNATATLNDITGVAVSESGIYGQGFDW